MNLLTLEKTIGRIVDDPSYCDELQDFINEGLDDVSSRVLLPGLRASDTVNTWTEYAYLPMPDNYQRELFHVFDTTTNTRVPIYRSLNQLLADYPSDYQQSGALFGCAVEPTSPQYAQGTITFSGVPVEDETLVVDSQTFTFKTLRAGAGEITIGADESAMATNTQAAMALDLTSVSSVASGATVVVTASEIGAVGNDIALTTEATNVEVDGPDTLGGTTLGVKTAYLRCLRTPSEAHTLRLEYFRLADRLTAPHHVPYCIPDEFHKRLLVHYAVKEILTEIHAEDNNVVIDRYESKYREALAELKLNLGTYAREPQKPTDTMNWDTICNGF